MLITYSMKVCRAQHLATNTQGQGHLSWVWCLGHISYKGNPNSFLLHTIITNSMTVCRTQYLVTKFQGQGHKFDSNLVEKLLHSDS